MNSFKSLSLPEPISKALDALRFDAPTPIQAQSIPISLTGKDVIGIAQTGTGKTAAFCIPILKGLLEDKSATALILTPTRELAQQIITFWKELSRFSPGMHGTILIGGVAMQPQLRELSRRPRLIVATPGRLIDHLERRSVQLTHTRYLVLDEADRMLDMGFAPQLGKIRRQLPNERQTLLFSATWATEVDRLSAQYLRNPQKISVGQASRAAATIEQTVLMTSAPKKNETLLDEINKRPGSILVFARTKSRTDRVAKYLLSYGMHVHRIHGGRSQAQRNTALNEFRQGRVRVLIATDIASRGIDVADIGHVINYDLPQSAEDYVHRIGRTGRAGQTGHAVSILTPEDRIQWGEIAKLLQKSGSTVPESPFHGAALQHSGRQPWQHPGKPRHDRSHSQRRGRR